MESDSVDNPHQHGRRRRVVEARLILQRRILLRISRRHLTFVDSSGESVDRMTCPTIEAGNNPQYVRANVIDRVLKEPPAKFAGGAAVHVDRPTRFRVSCGRRVASASHMPCAGLNKFSSQLLIGQLIAIQ